MSKLANFVTNIHNWSLLVIIFLLVGLALGPTIRLIRLIRMRRLSNSEKWNVLRGAVLRTRLPLRSHERDLIGDTFFPVRVLDNGGNRITEPLDRFRHLLREGRSFHAVGEAGAGKTAISLELRRQSAADESADFLVDVLHARDWIRSSHLLPQDSLVDWAAVVLAKRYRAFDASYLRELILDGRLILTVDGLDELDEEFRKNFDKYLAIHAQALPIGVFRREKPGTPTQLLGPVVQFATISTFSISPWTEESVRQVLADRVTWLSEIEESPKAAEIWQVLTNPLRLHVVLKTWGDQRSAATLAAADNPAAHIWEQFVVRFVDQSPLSVNWPAFPRYIRAISLLAVRSSSGFVLSSVLYAHHARRIARIASVIVILFLGWHRDSFTSATILTIAVIFGLRSTLPQSFVRLTDRFGEKLILIGVGIAYWLLFRVLYIVYSMAANLISNLDVAASRHLLGQLFGPRYLESLFKFEISATMEELSSWGSWFYTVYIAIIATMYSLIDLADPTQNFLASGGGQAFTKRYPFTITLFLASLLILDFAYPAPIYGWDYIVGSFGTVSYIAAATLPICRYIHVSPVKFIRLAQSLNASGIAEYRHGRVRFMHDEVTDVLAKRALLEEADMNTNAAKITRPDRYFSLLYTWMRPEEIQWAKATLRQLSAARPRDGEFTHCRVRFALYALMDFAEAESVIRRSSSGALRTREGRAASAETMWCSGQHDQAFAAWRKIRRRSPLLFLESPYAQALAISGDPNGGILVLQSYLRRFPEDETGRSRLAEMLIRYGSDSQVDEARRALAELTQLPNHRLYRATLELARLAYEVDNDAAESLSLLGPYLSADPRGCDDLAAARAAQIYSGTNDVQRAKEFARIGLLNRDWQYDPIDQLEILVTSSVILKDPAVATAAEWVTNLGWRINGRAKFGDWVRAGSPSQVIESAVEFRP